MNRSLFVFIAILLIGGWSAAPARAQLRPSVEVSGLLGLPQGEFGDRVGAGGGLQVYAGLQDARSPVAFGVNLGVLIYGIERRREPFSTTIPDVMVDVETTNNIFLGHLVLRLQPPGQRTALSPYVHGLFGFKYLFTETRIESDRFDEEIAASTNFDDAALSYGLGGGVRIRLYHGPLGEGEDGPARPGRVDLNVGLDYLFGAEAEYLKKGSIRREGGGVSFDVERSATALLLPSLGVTLTF
ncbi:hypothetical protein AWN76_006735 [Rhodothermaceae bacterium RA]|nr:hypothetical protein AWN76_006735 [Rhodothermaceae bacterium RA]